MLLRQSLRYNMNSKAFNILRAMAEIYLPTLATLVAAIGAALSLPASATVVGVIVALNTAVGAVVKYYRAQYQA